MANNPKRWSAGRYTEIRELGGGGMGLTYEARDGHLWRSVVVKTMREELVHILQLRARFAREARALAAANHPNVTTIYDFFGGDAEQSPYMIVEYLSGGDLRRLLNGQPIVLADAMSMLFQAVSGVAAAHALGIVHRDIKPDNILVSAYDVVKVTDFGLAHGASSRLDSVSNAIQTPDGAFVGTYQYAAPEQWMGLEAGPPADVFSLGVVMFEMLTGHRPYPTVPPHMWPKLSMKLIPESVQDLLRRCLSIEPKDRPSDAGALANELTPLRPGGANLLQRRPPELREWVEKCWSDAAAMAGTTARGRCKVSNAMRDSGGRYQLYEDAAARRATLFLILYFGGPGMDSMTVFVQHGSSQESLFRKAQSLEATGTHIMATISCYGRRKDFMAKDSPDEENDPVFILVDIESIDSASGVGRADE